MVWKMLKANTGKMGLLFILGLVAGCGRVDEFNLYEDRSVKIDNQWISAQRFVKCFRVSVGEICVPSIGKGKRLVARVDDSETALFRSWIEKATGTAGSLVQITAASHPAEDELLHQSGEKVLWDISSFLPKFMSDKFNQSVNFSGPNCYHTALSLAGTVSETPPRHVSREEFDYHLSQEYEESTTPRWGDLVLFDAHGSRDHVAYYLFDGLIFHKKGYAKAFGYRVTHMDQAFVAEPFEISPTLPGGVGSVITDDLSGRPRAYFRKKSIDSGDSGGENSKLNAAVDLANYVSEQTFILAPAWSVGSKMGTMIEGLAARLLRELEPLKVGTAKMDQRAYVQLKSAHDQMFVSIEESLYSSPFAEPNRINRDYCWHHNDFLKGLIQKAWYYSLGTQPTEAMVEAFVQQKMQSIDRQRCQIDMIKLIKDSEQKNF